MFGLDKLAQPQIQPNPAAAVEPAPYEQPSGLFGIRGTFRDILGTLGDTFLMQAGQDPLYRNTRMQERRSEALHGFAENPMAAIERLRQLDPAGADEMLQNLQEQQAREQELAMDQERLGFARDANRRDAGEYQITAAQYGAGLMGTATEDNWPLVRQTYIANMDRLGADYAPPPEEYNEDFVNMVVQGAIDPATQARLADADANINLSRERNEISRGNLRIREEDVAADNERADRTQSERERRNRVTERQADERNDISRNRGSGSTRRQPPTSRYVRQNGITFDTQTGLPVNQ